MNEFNEKEEQKEKLKIGEIGNSSLPSAVEPNASIQSNENPSKPNVFSRLIIVLVYMSIYLSINLVIGLQEGFLLADKILWFISLLLSWTAIGLYVERRKKESKTYGKGIKFICMFSIFFFLGPALLFYLLKLIQVDKLLPF